MVTAFIGFDFYIKTHKKSVDVFMTYCFVLQKFAIYYYYYCFISVKV